MTIGTDTYILPEGVTEYAAREYFDGRAEFWGACEDARKAHYLTRALEIIDNLPLAGRKHIITQPLAFPRISNVWHWWEIPADVAKAQAEIALTLMALDLMGIEPDGKRTPSKRADDLLRCWLGGYTI